MSSFTGTSAAEIIAIGVVSASVGVRGLAPRPSADIDTVFAGGGNDFVLTGGGNDIVYLGSGDDVFVWNPGDGSDFVDGQSGNDMIRFNGSNASEQLRIERGVGTGIALTRDIGAVRMNLQGMERLELAAARGVDTIAIGNLAGSTVRAVAIDLGAGVAGSAGDGAADAVAVDGTGNGETILVTNTANGVAIGGLAAAVTIDSLDATDRLTVAAGGGNDTVDARAIAVAGIALTLDGGAGADSLFGGVGADVLIGDAGNDEVIGGRGNDTAFLGADDDRFVWRPGDGSDVVEGQSGTDTLEFVGANAAEVMSLVANGGRATLLRDVGNIVMDLDDVEHVTIAALGGADSVTIGDLVGTDVTHVELDLAGSGDPTSGDGAIDSVVVNASNGDDVVVVAIDAGRVTVSGLATEFRLAQADTIDLLRIRAGGGNDLVDASALSSELLVTLDGGLGGDVLIGSGGADDVIGGDGEDLALLGAGDDRFVWQPGDDSDVIEGQAGFDTLDFRGANASEFIELTANGGRAVLFRNVGNVTQDVNDVEKVTITALGGADTIVVNELDGTDVTDVEIVLNADGQADTVTVRGTAAADVAVIVGDASGVSVIGLAARVDIVGFEAGIDLLIVETLGGNDVIDASGVGLGSMLFTLSGGDDDDILVGSAGNDRLLGGNGDDVLLGNGGVDILDGGAGNNVVIQGAAAVAPTTAAEVPALTLVGSSEMSMNWLG